MGVVRKVGVMTYNFRDPLENLKLEIEKKDDGYECKGLFFRASVSYYHVDGEKICHKAELRLLKRKSCTGCNKCGSFFEHLSIGEVEDLIDMSGIENGKIYAPVFVEDSRDYEGGYCDDWHWEFTKVEEDKGDD